MDQILSPQSWPWADPTYFLRSFYSFALFLKPKLTFFSAIYISALVHFGSIYFLWKTSYFIPYSSLFILLIITIIILPHSRFLKNRILMFKKQSIIISIILFVLWYIWGPFIFSLIVWISFFVIFDIFPILVSKPRNLIFSFILLIVDFFICGNDLFGYVNYFIIFINLFKIFVMLLGNNTDPTDPNYRPDADHENQNQQTHTHSHSHQQPHSHSHSHSHQPHSHSHGNNKRGNNANQYPQFVDTPDGGQLKFEANGKVFFKTPQGEIMDVTTQFYEHQRANAQKSSKP